jgi:Bacterial TniB protein
MSHMETSDKPARLINSAKAVLDADEASRIAYIRALPLFGYPRAQEGIARLEDLYSHPPISRMPNLLIYGETNNGKTVIADAFVERHAASDNALGDYVTVPVLLVQAPPGGEEMRLLSAILRRLYAPLKQSRRMDYVEGETLRLLRHVNVRILMIDEVHHLLAAGPRGQRQFLHAIKWLGNELRIPIVAFGTEDAFHAINVDPQLANRFERFPLPRWSMGPEYLRVLDSFEARLPIRRRSYLRSDEVANRILGLSEGTIGEIATIIKRAAVRAVKTGEERINMRSLERIGYTPPSRRRSEV